MGEDNGAFKFYDYLLRERSVDDGNMIVTDVAGYKPSPWGLYDIYGNVAEWTQSDYAPIPTGKGPFHRISKRWSGVVHGLIVQRIQPPISGIVITPGNLPIMLDSESSWKINPENISL
jgi:hypothetical protein